MAQQQGQPPAPPAPPAPAAAAQTQQIQIQGLDQLLQLQVQQQQDQAQRNHILSSKGQQAITKFSHPRASRPLPSAFIQEPDQSSSMSY